MRIAVLGLYNSGSTAIAGMLFKLGVNMAPPFWAEFYEPYDLSWHLRKWWDEPRLIERVDASRRICFLSRWIELQECGVESVVGAKHPLLSLSGPELVEAWGQGVKFIWCYRSLEASIAGLQRRHWCSRGTAVEMQTRLWNALHEFEKSNVALTRISWEAVKKDPSWAARQLANIVEIDPTSEQIESAKAIISRSSRKHRNATGLGRRLYATLRSKLSIAGE